MDRDYYNFEAIQDLNAVSPVEGLSEANNTVDGIDPITLARELDFFATSEFFDFDVTSPSSAAKLAESGNSSKPVQHRVKSETPGLRVEDKETTAQYTRLLSNDVVNSDTDFVKAKRKLDDLDAEEEEKSASASTGADDGPINEASVAAEDDKRRRNTLASARFRAKKKEREKALETEAKEMRGKVEELKERIKELVKTRHN